MAGIRFLRNTKKKPVQSQKDSYEAATETHQALSAWFLGPKAENSALLKEHLTGIVDRIARARNDYFPQDPAFITVKTQSSEPYKHELDDMQRYITLITDLLSRYSVPTFSPRYAGHMCFDNAMPATLGYLAAMLHNPNNVAVEASPLTSYVEYCVGQQLCKMLGYRIRNDAAEDGCHDESQYKGWGHITCDGSVANLESMWVARSLKYYPLSLKWAIEEGELGFIAQSFTIPLTCANTGTILFVHASTFDLLNLKPEVVLDIPNRLCKQFGISPEFLDAEVGKYLVQTIGREPIERKYAISRTPKYLVSKMNHYSWPKGAAILGIGRDNVHQIDVDADARMDAVKLEAELLALTRAGHSIYAVVAIMGTTEHGAIDPLEDILKLRRKFQDEHGVSFLVHCDAAWGGYFASLLHPAPEAYKSGRALDDEGSYVPEQALSSRTETQLRCMRHADSITVDPHKSGYVPYPAGGLCYRDERARYLITWTGPYIDGGAGAAAAMGVFGLEGSKPGAAPVAAYVAHEVLGLHRGGYGALLGEAMFTSVKMYSHWVTMGLDSHTLLVTPLTMLPAERDGAGAEAVEAQRRYIRECITNRPNRELVQDAEAMTLVKQMGSDLSINAFACNFRVSRGGPPNRDVAEASYLNARIIERLSVTRVDDEAQSKPLILMGTELGSERYGEFLRKFKGRLGLDEDDDAPLAGLCNVSMSVFPTAGNFVAEMAEAFRKVAEEEVENCWKRIRVVPAIHSFVMHGTSTLYLTYLPIFNLGSYRQQLIVSAKLPKEVMDAYAQAQRASPGAVFTVHTSTDELLSSVLQRGKCMVDIRQGLPPLHGFNADAREFSRLYVELTDIVVIKHTSLAPRNHSKQYPKFMPFFLYGSPEQLHIDHVLLKSPNAQLSCSGVGLELEGEATVKGLDLQKGVIVVLDEIREHASQPYGRSHQPEFFASGRSFNASVYADPFDGKYSKHPLGISSLYEKLEAAQPLAKGRITLGDSVYVDATHLNCDTVPKLCITPREKLTLDQLMLSATTDYEKIKKDFAQVASHSRAIASADIEQHIVANATLSDKYVLRPADEASFGEDQPTLQISRFAFSGPSDKHSRKLAVRQGWKDAFDQALVDYKVQSANRPVIHT